MSRCLLVQILALCCSLPASGQGTANPATSPAGFATAASAASARVLWSQNIGRLDSGESHAVFTALAVENPAAAATPTQFRGLRVDLNWAGGSDSLYVDESLLPPEKEIFDKLSADLDRPNALHGGSRAAITGSGEFRSGSYPLVADYQVYGPEGSGLRILSSGHSAVLFTGSKPTDLSNLLARAITALANAH